MAEKNFKTQHGQGLQIEGKGIEEIKEMQKQGIIKAKEQEEDNGDNQDDEG